MNPSSRKSLPGKFRPLLLAVLVLLSFCGYAQTYNPSLHVVANDAISPAQATPVDSRSMFYDQSNFVYRPYASVSEVKSYLNLSKYRTGNFLIVVDSGGVLQPGGFFTGGQNNIFMFKDGTADGNLVELNLTGSSGCVGCLLSANNLSDVGSASTARTNLGLGTIATQNVAGSGDVSGNWPNLTVSKFNGQLPSFYLNYLNLSNTPAIPAQLNPTGIGLVSITGTYPNLTWNGVTPTFEQTLLKLNTTSQLDSINIGANIFRIFGTSALGIPSGTTAQRPSSPIFGDTRANTDSAGSPLETWNGSAWVHPSGSGGGGGGGISALTGDVTASGTGSVPATLATVNTNVFGSNTFLKFAVNGKGLTTSATAVVSVDITGALGFTPYNATNPAGYIPLTALSATSPLAYNNTTGVFSMPAAATAQNGYLTSTDWNTFSAKLTSVLTNGNIFVGNGSSVAASVTPSGDWTMTNTGVSTISNNAITTVKINNAAVTYIKIQNAAGSSVLLGAQSPGVLSEITLGTNLSMTGGVLNATTAGAQTLTYTQNALNNNLAISGGNSVNFLIATATKAGLIDSAHYHYLDSLYLGLKVFNITTLNGLSQTGGDTLLFGGSLIQNTTLNTGGFDLLVTNLPNKTVGAGDSALIENSTGKVYKASFPSSGINQLTGDVTAGPGSGSQAATISALAVTTGKIAANAVTLPKLSTGPSNQFILYDASGNPTTSSANLTWSGTVLSTTGFLASGAVNLTGTTYSAGGASFDVMIQDTLSGKVWRVPYYPFDTTGFASGNTNVIFNGSKLLLNTPSAGFVNPMTTVGDLIVGGTSGTPLRLATGTSSQVLIGGTAWGSLNLATMSGSSILAVANGGTGTSTPGLVNGTNISITGTWPNQTINSTVAAPPFADNISILKNNADNTKQIKFDLSAITTGITRTWTFPNTNGTFARSDSTNVFPLLQKVSFTTSNATLDGLILLPTNVATLGAPKYSPAMHFEGSSWNTTSSAVAPVDFWIKAAPISNTSAFNGGTLAISGSFNGGAEVVAMNIGTNGFVGFGQTAPAAPVDINTFASTGGTQGLLIRYSSAGAFMHLIPGTADGGIFFNGSYSASQGLHYLNNGSLGLGVVPTARFNPYTAGATYSGVNNGVSGVNIAGGAWTFNDNSTAANGINNELAINAFGIATVTAANTGTVDHIISTLRFSGAPIQSTNVTGEHNWVIYVKKDSSVFAGPLLAMETTGNQFTVAYDSTHKSVFNVNSSANLDISGMTGITLPSAALPNQSGADSVFTSITSAGVVTVGRKAISSFATSNIYSADGTLAGNRTITTGGNNLTLSGTGLFTVSSGVAFAGINTSGDNNYTSSADFGVILPTVTANRTITLPTATTNIGRYIEFMDRNTGTFTWSFTNTVKDGSGNTVTTLSNQTIYLLQSDGAQWNVMNSYIESGRPIRYQHNISTPSTGGTVALTNNQYNIINPSGSLATLTVNFPSSPLNNDVVYVKYTQAVATVTYGNGTVTGAVLSPTAGYEAVFVFDSGTSKWY